MVFADRRYGRSDKIGKLPAWIREYLKPAHLNLSTDMMLYIAKAFMCKMAQPFPRSEQAHSLLTEAQVHQLEQSGNEMDVDQDPATQAPQMM